MNKLDEKVEDEDAKIFKRTLLVRAGMLLPLAIGYTYCGIKNARENGNVEYFIAGSLTGVAIVAGASCIYRLLPYIKRKLF